MKELHDLLENAIEFQWKNSSEANDSLIKKLLDASNGQISEEEMLSDVVTMFTIGLQVTWASKLV